MSDHGQFDPDGGSVSLPWLAAELTGLTVKKMSHSIAQSIRTGRLPAGTRLPTVRSFAQHVNVSPSTVAHAWANLRADGLIETRQRGGTIVAQVDRVLDPPAAHAFDWSNVDLRHGSPDPALQPQLDQALTFGLEFRSLHNGHNAHVIEPLIAAVASSWPFAAEAWTTAGGGTEGNLLAALAATGLGGVAAIEQPTSPRTVAALKSLGIQCLPVPWDDEGPALDSLEQALAQGPASFIYQPRAHMPLGRTVTPERSRAMAALLAQYPQTMIVEDDGLGPLARTPLHSVGTLLPERTLLVRSFCKAFGVDLRVCVLGGAKELVERVRQHRSFGVGLSSRILQGAVAFLLTDPKAAKAIERARHIYATRRETMRQALAERGIASFAGEGVALWLDTPNESETLIRLMQQGIRVGSGAGCFVSQPPAGHLRLGVTRLPDDRRQVDRLAGTIADAILYADSAIADVG